MDLKARDIMTQNPIPAVPGMSLKMAAALMDEQNVGCLPVVDGGARMRPTQVITDRDIVRSIHRGEKLRVRDIMPSGKLVVVHPDDSVAVVIKKMMGKQICRIPVVDGNGRLVGIIATADVDRNMTDDKVIADLHRAISKP